MGMSMMSVMMVVTTMGVVVTMGMVVVMMMMVMVVVVILGLMWGNWEGDPGLLQALGGPRGTPARQIPGVSLVCGPHCSRHPSPL